MWIRSELACTMKMHPTVKPTMGVLVSFNSQSIFFRLSWTLLLLNSCLVNLVSSTPSSATACRWKKCESKLLSALTQLLGMVFFEAPRESSLKLMKTTPLFKVPTAFPVYVLQLQISSLQLLWGVACLPLSSLHLLVPLASRDLTLGCLQTLARHQLAIYSCWLQVSLFTILKQKRMPRQFRHYRWQRPTHCFSKTFSIFPHQEHLLQWQGYTTFGLPVRLACTMRLFFMILCITRALCRTPMTKTSVIVASCDKGT